MVKHNFHFIIFSYFLFSFFILIGGCTNNNPVVPTGVPSVPSLISPNNGDTTIGSSIVFKWNPSTYATSYRIQLSSDTLFSNIIFTNELISIFDTVSTSSFSNYPIIYWHVCALNSKGTSSYSSSRHLNRFSSSDEQYLQSVIISGFSYDQYDDDNLMYNEQFDMNDVWAIPDSGHFNVVDSIKRWGRIITGTNYSFNGSFSGDTIYNVMIQKTLTGYYRIIGYYNGGQIDSITKPFVEQTLRNAVFKRIARNPNPRYDWRLYKVSLLTGITTQPQNGSSYSNITSIQVSVNGIPAYSWSFDFLQNIFTTIYFGGTGIPEFHLGDQLKIDVTISSTEQNNYVAWHWARNTFGFNRVPFDFVSSSPGGNGYLDLFSKTFTIYSQHEPGSFNGFISASTHESLFDDDASKLAATEVGIPYEIRP